MRKRTSVAFLAVLGLLLFGCGKKTTKEQPTTKTPTPVTTTAKPTTKKEEKKFTVTVNSDNQNAGTIDGVGQAVEGTDVKLTAKPNQGYTFLGFYDGANKVSDGNSTTYTISKISKDVTLTAKWAVQSFTLNVTSVNEDDSAVEAGTVTYEGQDVEGKLWETDTVITLTATPLTGYQFNGWYLVGATDPLSTDAEYDFHMLGQNTTLEAHFGVKQCTIEVVASDADAIKDYFIWNSVDDDEVYNQSITVNYGTNVQIGADANNGYEYVALYVWNEEGIYVDADKLDVDYNFTATDSVKFYAVFEPLDYMFYVYNNNRTYGQIDFKYGELEGTDWDSVDMAYNSTATITAVAHDGYSFIGWYADGSYSDDDFISDSATYTLKMICSTENWDDWAYEETIYALFAPNAVTVKVSVDTVDGEGNPVATATIIGDCEYGKTINLKYSDLNPAYDYVGVFTKVYNEETEEYDYEKLPGSYYYNTGFAYTISSLEEVNLYFVFELGTRTTFFYTNIEELSSQLYEEVAGHYGDAIDKTAPTIPGYTFVGWFDDAYVGWDDDDQPYYTSDPISTDSQFPLTNTGYDGYWCWYTRNEYNIRYNKDAGMVVAKNGATVQYGINYTLDVPTLDQYVFQYWYIEDSNWDEVPLTDAFGRSLAPYDIIYEGAYLQVYAKWEKDTVNAVFNTTGGSDIATQAVTIGHSVTRPPKDPEKEGYTFVDWYTSEEGGTLWNFATPIDSNVEIFAHWTINSYTLEVTAIDDSIITVNDDINDTYEYNTEVQLTASIDNPGYGFLGWFVNGSDEAISTEAIYLYNIPAENVTVEARYYAKQFRLIIGRGYYTDWVKNTTHMSDCTFEVSSDDGVDKETATTYYCYYGSTVTIECNNYDGWYVFSYTNSSTGGSNFIPVNNDVFEIVMPNTYCSITVYYKTEMHTMSVSKNIDAGDAVYFLRNSDTDHLTSRDIPLTNKIKAVASEVTGYTFLGWYNGDEQVSEELIYEFEMPNEAVNIVAMYEINEYNLSVKKSVKEHAGTDVTNLHNDDHDFNTTYTLSVSAKEGYTFKGWFLNGSNTPISTDLTYVYTIPAYDSEIVAVFEINEYEIYVYYWELGGEYNVTPGLVSFENDDYYYFDYNEEVTIELVSTILGYEWAGWSTSESADGIFETSTTLTFNMPANDMSIYPLWRPLEYQLIYTTDGTIAGGAAGKKVTMGLYYDLATASMTSKEFSGWYLLDEDLNKIYLTDGPDAEDPTICHSLSYFNYPQYADDRGRISIYPVWDTASYNVTLDYGYETPNGTVRVLDGTTIDPATIQPERAGYTFDKWMFGELEFNFATPITSAITLTATWTINQYTVTLGIDPNGCTTISDTDYIWGSMTYYVNDEINGTINDFSKPQFTVDFGTAFTLTATCNPGREFAAWIDENGNVISTDSTFVCPNEFAKDITIYATYSAVEELAAFEFVSGYILESPVYIIYGLVDENVTTLVVPNYISMIAEGAFARAIKLRNLTIPFTGSMKNESETEGEIYLFGYIFGKESISGTSKRIQYYFANSSATTATAAPARYIPSSLAYITVTDTKYLHSGALYDLDSVSKFTFTNLEVIGRYALADLDNSKTFVFPDTLKEIRAKAFDYGYGVVNVTLPNANLTKIDNGAFSRCKNLANITVPFIGNNINATGADGLFGVLFDGTSTGTGYYTATQYYGSSSTKSYNIPNALTSITINPKGELNIPFGAFSGLTGVKNITLNSNNVIAINSYAFYKCSSLKNVVSNRYIRTINDYAFAYCTSFVGEEEIIEEQVYSEYVCEADYVGNGAFYGCTSLVNINFINANLYQIGSYAFENCSSLASINLDCCEEWLIVGVEAFAYCTSLSSFEVELLEYAESNAFEGCTNLESFTVDTIYCYLNDFCFVGCTKLTTVSINDMFSIEDDWTGFSDYCFADCTSLTTITIPTNVNRIGEAIFAGCSSLSNITAPFVGIDADCDSYLTQSNISSSYDFSYYFGTDENADMKRVGQSYTSGSTTKYIVRYVPNLNITYTLTNIKHIPTYAFASYNMNDEGTAIKSWNAIKFSKITISGYQSTTNNAHKVGDVAFTGLWYTTIVIADGMTEYGERAFENAYYTFRTGSSVLPNTLKTIGIKAFYGCVCSNASGTSIVIPDSVTSIGDYAFTRWTNTNIMITIGKNAVLGASVFSGADSSIIYINYIGSAVEFNALKTKWNANWKNGSSIASVVPDGGTGTPIAV